jgi:hypothetical protein
MDTDNIAHGVAEAVTELQREAHLTQAQVSDRAPMPRTTLQRRLVDGNFTVLELGLIARVFGVTPEDIVSRASDIVRDQQSHAVPHGVAV